MASSRVSAVRSLRRAALIRRQTRHLHITDSINHPIRLAATPPSASVVSRENAGAETEHARATRAFSTSDSAYDSTQPLYAGAAAPSDVSPPFAPTNQKTRHFTSSGARSAMGDSSTIDFAYLPEFPMPNEEDDESMFAVRVPILPLVYSEPPPAAHPPRVSEVLADHSIPTVATVAGESTHLSAPSALSDVHDAGGHLLDFHEVAETLTAAAKKVTLGTDRDADAEGKHAKGLAKQIWTGLLVDLFGPPQQKPRGS